MSGRRVLSAQAWHWIDPEVGYGKAHELLAPGGALALFWHRLTAHGEAVDPELRALLARDAPTLVDAGVDDDRAEEIHRSGRFGEVSARSYAWAQTYTTERYLHLLTTHSEVRMLSDDRRLALLRLVRRLIDREGGELRVGYTTRLFLARATCGAPFGQPPWASPSAGRLSD